MVGSKGENKMILSWISRSHIMSELMDTSRGKILSENIIQMVVEREGKVSSNWYLAGDSKCSCCRAMLPI